MAKTSLDISRDTSHHVEQSQFFPFTPLCPCGDPPFTPRPVLCLPTSYILLSLQQKKHQFPKFPMRTALSLAADLRWPTGFHFDRRLQLVASPTAQSLTDASSCHYRTHHTHITHVFRLIFDVWYDGNVLSGVTQLVSIKRWLFGGIESGYCIDWACGPAGLKESPQSRYKWPC